MELHKDGPYTANKQELLVTWDGVTTPVQNPSMLIDKETLTIHKMGSREYVEKKFNKMVAALVNIGEIGKPMLDDLLVITFDDTSLSTDDLATIFNTCFHCSHNNILKTIIENNTTNIRNEIETHKKYGY